MLKVIQFENDVKMYGTQTLLRKIYNVSQFENDVKMYGIQTLFAFIFVRNSLRMM